MDAGGLAQMTYNNNFPANSGIGMPSAGFASRGKGSQLKRLSVNPPSSIPENEGVSTPRTARGHLLAGLRTAPKTPGGVPSSAPFGQTQHRVGLETSRFAQQQNNTNRNSYQRQAPQTASAATFASAGYNNFGANAAFAQQQQMYPMVEQPLAPPSFHLDPQELQQMDPEVLADMMRQSLYLEQKRKLLEQQIQLISLQAQHSRGMTFNPLMQQQQQQYSATPLSPTSAMFAMNGIALDDSLAHGLGLSQDASAGQYMFWNAQTGQYNYIPTAGMSHVGLASSPPPPTPSFSSSPPNGTPRFRAEVSPPSDNVSNPFDRRTPTPPKNSTTPPSDVAPLPPTSNNGWRRNHKKVTSMGFGSPAVESPSETPKPTANRTSAVPQTPMTGTFGPGQARAGEHPIRQPRGPPPMDELLAAPTTKQEGSKNFAARQRRGALSKLVRAGLERRGNRSGSPGSMTPVSETDPIFSLAGSDNDSDSGRSLSGRPSIGSLRAQASGAIGSERKKRRDSKERSRDRTDSHLTSLTSEEVANLSLEEGAPQGERKRMPMLLLNSAEKRKTAFC